MAAERLVTLATFSSPIEAALARNRLVAEGIPVFLDNQASNSLWGGLMGTALSGIELQVPEIDAMRAEDILVTLAEEIAGKDGEVGPEDSPTTDEPPEEDWTAEERESASDITAVLGLKEPAISETNLTAQQPAPALADAASSEDGEAEGKREQDLENRLVLPADMLARRAFLAAIWGPIVPAGLSVQALIEGTPVPPLRFFLLVPGGILTLYSLWLLNEIRMGPGKLSRGGVVKAWLALFINVVVLGLVLLFWLAAVRI